MEGFHRFLADQSSHFRHRGERRRLRKRKKPILGCWRFSLQP